MTAARRLARRARCVVLAGALGCGGCSYLLAGAPLFGAAQNVAQGGCLAQCSPGWRCDPESALCERERPDAAVLGAVAEP